MYLDHANNKCNNLFAYCNNNPISNADENGTCIWIVFVALGIAATAHDLYQIFRSDKDKKVDYSIDDKGVIINNSREILTPWVRYIYI